jgi:hypothetical protein
MSFLLTLFITAVPACTTSTDGGTVILCGDAKVLVSLAVGAPKEVLPNVVDGMARLYTAVEKHDAEVQLNKQRLPAIDLTLLTSATDKTPVGTARVTAIQERDGVSRVLICVREPAVPVEHCQPGFEAALRVSNPTAPDAALPDRKGQWAGATLTVPPGCKLAEPGSLQCKTASLMWGDRPSDGPLNSQKVLSELAVRQLPKGSTASERVCRIGGKASTCTVLRSSGNGTTFSIIIGVGDFKGRWTSFQCIALSDLKDVVPAPCEQLVTFTAGK